MGLLEKALQFKQEINKKGKETLIDRIEGPADTEFEKSIPEQENDDIFSLPEEDGSPSDTLKVQRQSHDEEKLQDKKEKKEPDKEPAGGKVLMEEGPLGSEDEPEPEYIKKTGNTVQDQAETKNEEVNEDIETNIDSDEESTYTGKPDKKFQDFLILYEIGKEIVKARTLSELYDVILFSIMGQIGASSSSILIIDSNDTTVFKIAESRGITIKNKKISFSSDTGIMNKITSSREIIDIEGFSNNQEYQDEYYQFISIDARLVCPLRYDGQVYGAIVLGDKITIGDYTDEEKDFIRAVSEIAAIAFEKVHTISMMENDIDNYRNEMSYFSHVRELQDELRRYASLSHYRETVQNELSELGVMSYAVFIEDYVYDRYKLVTVEEKDLLSLDEDDFFINKNSSLASLVADISESTIIDEFDRMKSIKDAFGDNRIKKMTLFWMFPMKIGENLVGFMLVFKLNDYSEKERLFNRISATSNLLLLNYLGMESQEHRFDQYIDVVLPVYKRIESEVINASRLNIPVTVVLFSIKNFKRYMNTFGNKKTDELLKYLESTIMQRLSDTDFTVRIDRNKFLLVLPGKNKKYAVPLANTIRNEMVQNFSTRELQLLITFLMAEFPEDGDNPYSLLDAID